MTAFDMFSGCGGLTEGLKGANFSVVGAVELDEFAAENYLLNHSEVRLWREDVRHLTPTQVLDRLEMQPGDLDLLAGCPPCQGFSRLRTRNGALSDNDTRNALLDDFLRFVEGLMPKAVMLENVPGLSSYSLFGPFCDRLSDLGYIGQSRVLDAADYSVAQRRKRLIYLAGYKHPIDFAAIHSTRLTVRDAFYGLQVAGGSGDAIHDLPENRTPQIRYRISLIPKDGGSRKDMPQGAQLKCHLKCDGFKDVYGRMSWDRISPTITGGCFNPSKGRFLHPEEDRAITMREAALLQGFPPYYKFSIRRGKGPLAQMIGNALPPPFIRANALAAYEAISANSRQHAGKTQ